MAGRGALGSLEVFGHAEDIHDKEAAVRGAIAHDPGEVQGKRRLTLVRGDGDRGRFVGPTIMLQLGRFR